MKLIFEWDAKKANANIRKHRVTFDEARTVFDDPLLVTYPDDFHSDHEDRYISIGFQRTTGYCLLSILKFRKPRKRLLFAS